MYQEEINLSYGEGRYRIYLFAIITLDGVSITITGGDKPHVGGTALSIARPSLKECRPSCDTWITPVPGHQDSQVAEMVSRLVCVETGHTTAVTAGIHLDRARPEEIDLLIGNSRECARLLINRIEGE